MLSSTSSRSLETNRFQRVLWIKRRKNNCSHRLLLKVQNWTTPIRNSRANQRTAATVPPSSNRKSQVVRKRSTRKGTRIMTTVGTRIKDRLRSKRKNKMKSQLGSLNTYATYKSTSKGFTILSSCLNPAHSSRNIVRFSLKESSNTMKIASWHVNSWSYMEKLYMSRIPRRAWLSTLRKSKRKPITRLPELSKK